MTWRVRRALRSHIRTLEGQLPSLTRDQRHDILRQPWTPFLPRAA